jgi:hypothetical protein
MAITLKPKERAVEAFIEAADRPRKLRGKKVQISLALKPELLADVDAEAAKMGTTRAAYISRAIYVALQKEV